MRRVGRYLAFVRIAAARAVVERYSLVGQAAFLAVFLGIFSGLWKTVAEDGMPIPASPASLVWYLAITEWILMSVPLVHLDIESEVRRGDIAYHAARPVSLVAGWLAQATGAFLFRAPVLAVAAFAGAWAFTGELPDARVWLHVVPLGLVAGLVLTILHVPVGLLAFWLPDVSPPYWVAQKVLFVLGGLTLPLSLYPAWARDLALATPFPWLLWAPAARVIGSGEGPGPWALIPLGAWGVLALAATGWLHTRAHRMLQVNGG